MRILVLSPHYDDAPLSLGQSMLDGVLHSHRVTVGVVFSRSNWTRWVYPTRARRWPVTAARWTEEQWNSLRFGYRVRTGGLEELILRAGARTPEEILAPDHDVAADPELGKVAAVIASWVDEGAYGAVLAPLGVGGHVDHLLVASAARRIAATSALPWGFYEDRPYASVADDASIMALARSIDPRLAPVPLSGPVTARKHRRLFYPTQFDPFFADAMGDDERQARVERAWVPDAADAGPTPTPTPFIP